MKLSELARGHDNNFNLVRFLAAFSVLVSHSWSIVLGDTPNQEPFAHRIGYTLGGVAVDVFFITSGFLVTASLLRLDNLKEFARARALRILPALLPMSLLIACVIGPLFTSEPLGHYFAQGDVYKFIFKNATIVAGFKDKLPGVFEDHPLKSANGSLWTLPFEIRCYLSVALLWFLARKTTSAPARRFATWIVVVATVLLVGFWLSCAMQGGKWKALHDHLSDFRLFFMFGSGAVFHVLRERIRMDHWMAALLAILLAACVALLPAGFFWIYPPVIAYLVLYCAYVPGGWLRQFNRFGDYSYGIYIYAFPVQQTMLACFGSITVSEMIASAGLVTFLLAMLSWHLVEKRALRLKPKRALEFDRSSQTSTPSQGQIAAP